MLNYFFRIFSKLLILGVFMVGFSFTANGEKISTDQPLETYSMKEVLEAAEGFFWQ